MKRKGYSYLRVSGRGQLNGTGIDRQRTAIVSYAQKNRIEIIRTYEEQETGTTENRQQLAQMLKDLKQNPSVRFVLVEKLERLARDLLVSEKIIHDLKRLEVNLISVIEGEELLNGDPSRKLVRQLFGAVAEYDKSMTVEKLRLSREQIRATVGKCEGRKAVEEIAPDLLDEIRRLRRKRPHKKPLSYAKIAEILNDSGKRSVTGRPFTGKNIQYLLAPNRTKRAVRASKMPTK